MKTHQHQNEDENWKGRGDGKRAESRTGDEAHSCS